MPGDLHCYKARPQPCPGGMDIPDLCRRNLVGGGDAAGGIFSAPSPSTAAHCMATAEFSRTQHWEGCHF